MWQALTPKPPESKVRLVGLSAYWPYCHIGAQREIFSETGDSCRDSWGRFCRGPHLHKHSRPSCPADTSVPPPMEAPYGREWGDLWDLKSDQKVLFGYTTYMDSCFQLGASCLFFWSFYFMFFPPQVSAMTKIVPSPDWFVGLDSLQLCSDGHFIQSFATEVKTMNISSKTLVAFKDHFISIDSNQNWIHEATSV